VDVVEGDVSHGDVVRLAAVTVVGHFPVAVGLQAQREAQREAQSTRQAQGEHEALPLLRCHPAQEPRVYTQRVRGQTSTPSGEYHCALLAVRGGLARVGLRWGGGRGGPKAVPGQ